jgi:hypothetical protein
MVFIRQNFTSYQSRPYPTQHLVSQLRAASPIKKLSIIPLTFVHKCPPFYPNHTLGTPSLLRKHSTSSDWIQIIVTPLSVAGEGIRVPLESITLPFVDRLLMLV